MNLFPLTRGFLWIVSLVLVGFSIEHLQLAELVSTAWIDAEVRGRGLTGEAWFIVAGILFTAVGLPRQIIAFLGGYAFGVAAGCLLALLATLGGCVLAFYYARCMGRSLVATRFPRQAERLDRLVCAHPLLMTLLIRFLPVGSNLMTNLTAGVSRVPGLPFFAGSAAGYLPQTLVFALVGSGIAVDPLWRIGGGSVLFLLSGVIALLLYRRYRDSLQSLDDGLILPVQGQANLP